MLLWTRTEWWCKEVWCSASLYCSSRSPQNKAPVWPLGTEPPEAGTGSWPEHGRQPPASHRHGNSDKPRWRTNTGSLQTYDNPTQSLKLNKGWEFNISYFNKSNSLKKKRRREFNISYSDNSVWILKNLTIFYNIPSNLSCIKPIKFDPNFTEINDNMFNIFHYKFS